MNLQQYNFFKEASLPGGQYLKNPCILEEKWLIFAICEGEHEAEYGGGNDGVLNFFSKKENKKNSNLFF